MPFWLGRKKQSPSAGLPRHLGILCLSIQGDEVVKNSTQYVPSGYLLHSHGFSMAHRNIWFTELNSMVNLSMTMLKQMVYMIILL